MPSETAKASLGYVTSYGAARRGGYTGTYEEWCALMAEVADHLEENIQLNEDSQAAKAAAETAELEAEAAALTAESWAKGTKGGTDVPSTDPAYHDNAKYYAGEAEDQKDLAEQAASAAAGSAETAEGHSTDAEAWAAGTRGGDPVESGDDAYQNNAKYFSEQSAGSATAAAGSAETAESWATGGSGGSAGTQNNAKYYSQQAASSAQTAAAMGTNFAPEFSAGTAYSAGDYVLYLGTLYRFTADHAAGAWVGTDAAAEKIAPVIGDLKESVNDAPQINETDETYTDLDLADSQGYVLVRFFDGHIQTKKFNSANVKPGFEYKFSGSDLLLRYGYNDIYDAVIVLNRGRANNLFDFSALKLIPVGADLNEYETADLTQVWTSSTDMHGPFQFLAVNDADGIHADATSPSFTGGNHTLDNLGAGYETASSKFVKYFADGKPVDSGMGRATHFEIKWANNVQAYNTVKVDGTGRSCLTEYHDMIFDGVTFSEKVMLVPLEEIKMQLWYGFQFMSWGTTYTNIRFIDGINRQKFAYGDSGIVSGNELTSGMIAWGQDHTIEMTVDTNIDLGKRELYTGNNGAFISASKGYFSIIGAPMHTMAADSAYCLHGSFRFCPTVIS